MKKTLLVLLIVLVVGLLSSCNTLQNINYVNFLEDDFYMRSQATSISTEIVRFTPTTFAIVSTVEQGYTVDYVEVDFKGDFSYVSQSFIIIMGDYLPFEVSESFLQQVKNTEIRYQEQQTQKQDYYHTFVFNMFVYDLESDTWLSNDDL